MLRAVFLRLGAAAALALAAAAAPAQVATIDPNSAAGPARSDEPAAQTEESEYQPVEAGNSDAVDESAAPEAEPDASTASRRASQASTTVPRKDVFTAAEGVFGKGAEGLADLIEDLLRDRGDPTGYITGREAGGAFIAGVRYGSGTLHHSIEGDRRVYWTGPSVGFDFGANADKVFVLVYNLNDSERLFRRFPAGEGKAYVVGGFTASYLRRGDVVLIPVRLGVGARLGINAGYMRFSQKNRWLPF
ncbi:MAG TPA: DUF1134 domain-containing protein [Allosphingosinicella sp.]|jgi:hypothetical protein